jgi:hypothetical protein
MRHGADWWQAEIEEWLGCDDGADHVLCGEGVQLFYVLKTTACVGETTTSMDTSAAWVNVAEGHLVMPTIGNTQITWDNRTMCPIFGEVLVDPRLTNRLYSWVIRHEFGHILGLDHDDSSVDLGSIMAAEERGAVGRATGNDLSLIAEQIDSAAFCRN